MNSVRNSFRTRRYLSLQEKENKLLSTPEYVRKRPDIENLMEEGNCSQCANREGLTVTDQPPQIRRQSNRRTSMISTRYSTNNCANSLNSSLSVGKQKRNLSKSASVRLTVIDAVDTLRKKITSTAQLMSQGSLSNISARRRSMRLAVNTPPKCQHRQVKMHSPFEFATPEKRKINRKWCDTETPTKLRREVEALTADMQALASLTPNTLRTRAATRRQNADPMRKNSGILFSSRSNQLESQI